MSRRKDFKNHSGKKSGTRNITSKDICTILERIERLNFVNHVTTGNFKQKGSKPYIDIVGYDFQKKKYMLNIHGGKYVQKVILDVSKPDNEYETAIKNCAS